MARVIKITVEGNQQEEIVLSNSEGKQVVIKDNSTNAKTLFELSTSNLEANTKLMSRMLAR